MKKCNCNKPLTVNIKNGVLKISIGIETLKFAAEHCENFYFPHTEQYGFVVNNSVEFAKEVCNALMEESEDGSTRVHYMLDELFGYLNEQGALGLDIDRMEELEVEEAAAANQLAIDEEFNGQ